MALALSQFSTTTSSTHFLDLEGRSVASSVPGECMLLRLPSSEESDILSIGAGDLSVSLALSPQYEEPAEVLTRAVAKLNINWPAEKREAFKKR